MILADIEQRNLFNEYDRNIDWYHKDNDPVTSVYIPLFLCPTQTRTKTPPPTVLIDAITNNSRGWIPVGGWGGADYASINAVRNAAFVNSGLPSLGTREVLGALTRGPDPVLLTSILDGTSNTVMIGEGSGRPAMYILQKPALNPDTGAVNGTQFVKDGWGWADINTGFSIDGTDRQGRQNVTSGNGTVTANRGSCLINCTNDSELASMHPGGIHLLRVDASVQFYADSTSNQVLIALLTPASGDVPEENP